MNRILNLGKEHMALPVVQVVSPASVVQSMSPASVVQSMSPASVVQSMSPVSVVQSMSPVPFVQADPSNQNQTNNAARQELYIEVLKLVEDEVMRRRMSKIEQNIDIALLL